MSKSSTNHPSTSAFKRAQLRYRRQGSFAPDRAADFSELIDFGVPEEDSRIIPLHIPNVEDKCEDESSNDIFYRGLLFGLSSYPGFVYAPQALSKELQSKIAILSVSKYCERPHRTNIDLIPPREGIEENNSTESMWQLWKDENGFTDPHASDLNEANHKVKRNNSSKKKYRSFKKLSWTTMGYHYDWTARAYHEDAKSPVPPLLDNLAAMFAKTSFRVSDLPSPSRTFSGSACIVNYYSTKSIMGGHRDDLEFAMDKPVVSLSVGLPGIFLLGGNTKDDPVVPILVRPGDVMMMGGDSRLYYHGMARVLPGDIMIPALSAKVANDMQVQEDLSVKHTKRSDKNGRFVSQVDDFNALEKYLRLHRININVRQVLQDGVDRITSND
mmetsp:Transcript_19452/g.27496  ORF Transcript_19452/g.27496 Transcript_19452/m.27496 type:complete len:385 (+) Transcript_19452:158-1312(+)